MLSCFPAALYEHLRLPGKLGISTTPHCSAAATPALLQNLLENRDCRKPQGPSGDLAALWLHFLYLSLPLRYFPTPGFGAPFHLCTGFGNRKAEYWTNGHLSEYKTPCFQLCTVLNKHFFPLLLQVFMLQLRSSSDVPWIYPPINLLFPDNACSWWMISMESGRYVIPEALDSCKLH